MELGLRDKVVIITGGSRGLGREYALAFSREGAKVVVCDILDCGETVKGIQSIGGEVLSLKTDVTSEKETVEMARETFKHFGKIDILVNNAGIYGGLRSKFFDEIGVDEWDRMMESHAKGTFLCCKAVFPFMKEQKQGKIVNVASGVVFSASTGIDHYATAKGAVFTLTRVLARELGPYNINVNSVAPGLVLTQASLDLADETRREAVLQKQALKRLQQPDSPAGAVLFFASTMADDITGQCLLIDCGITMH